MAKVIIAEKPSVAKNIAEALDIKQKRDGYIEGKDYIITWAFGHLLQLYDARDYNSELSKWKMENFPFIPEEFKYKVKSSQIDKSSTDKGVEKQLNIIKGLIEREEVDGVISACDDDREGQIIGDLILMYLEVKKPAFRLLLNEWTPDEVLKGIKNLKDNTLMKPVQDSGTGRQLADWTIGINLTSVATLKYKRGKGHPLNIGRVLLPTLKIIYDRDKEIEAFIPNDFYKLNATFQNKDGKEIETTYSEGEEDKFSDKKKLEEVNNKLKAATGIVSDKSVEKKRENPPFLFNLSNLQGFVTSKFKGWTSDKVLSTAQALYEKKFITYPRTESVALEESLAERAEKVLSAVKKGLPYENDIKFQVTKRIFDNSKVESHSAIIPTYMTPKGLSEEEAIVYNAIKNRFVAQFMPVCEFEETKIAIRIKDAEFEGTFSAKGKVLIEEGWKKAEKIEMKEVELPFVELDEQLQLQKSKITANKTKPPKYHSEKTLLRVMETCGKKFDDEESEEMMDAILSGFSIGTAATRAETIKKLKDAGYIYAKDKNLICTELGQKLVENFPITELFDLEYTGRLEKTLSDIAKAKINKQDFLDLIFNFTREAVEKIKGEKLVIINDTREEKQVHESLGACPICGSDIVENEKNFGCSNWVCGCKFTIWKDDKFLASLGKKPNKAMVERLLKNGRFRGKGFKGKSGKEFDAYISYVKNEDNDYFSWKFEFINN
jgi:DNA topoisomerase III